MKTRQAIDAIRASNPAKPMPMPISTSQPRGNAPTVRSSRPLALPQLRALAAVARHLNFRAAAEELCLTQSAVSRQIQSLEDDVGVPLFHRHTRNVELSSAGTRLLRAVLPALERMDAAVRQIRAQSGRGRVVLSTWASFASLWLIPRLERFQAEHPDIDIHVHTSDSAVDLEASDADMALRYTRASGVPSGSLCMFGETVTAIASPWLLQSTKPVQQPQDLQDCTLIESGDAQTNQNLEWLTWHGWERSHRLPPIEPRRWLLFDFAQQQIQAALTGQGIALARLPLVADSLHSGELVEVLPDYRLHAPMAYWLATAERSQSRPEILALTEWLMAQASLTRQRMGEAGSGAPGF